MSYQAYKLLHLLGIFVLFGSLGGLAALRMAVDAGKVQGTRVFNVLHGLALAIVFIAGFGMLAKLGLGAPGSWGAWVWIKLVIWLLLGAGLAALKRAGRSAHLVLVLLTLLGAASAWAALFKP